MARHDSTPPEPRTVEALADSADLRSVMSRALAAEPVDEAALRRAVWTYVGGERHAGVSPGHVIMAVTRSIEEANLTPHEQRLAVTRRVILWCVEAYFGHLGGDVVGSDESALSDTGAIRVR
jgi:hypothetical protein